LGKILSKNEKLLDFIRAQSDIDKEVVEKTGGGENYGKDLFSCERL
jgi:hypothetical protein